MSKVKKEGESIFQFKALKKDTSTFEAFMAVKYFEHIGKKYYMGSTMDITELKRKDEMLINQSRHAAMGEMIGMIAHQWRQPLSTISMDANNMLLDIAMQNLDISSSEAYAKSISQQTQHLSKTIDDFRNFFKPDKVISKVNLKDVLTQTMSIVADSLKNNNIKLISSFEAQKQVKAYPRELMQVFVNIITNSKDALTHLKRDNAVINVRVYEDDKYINTQICDNGGGIEADILSKVFDPYFSTKDEKTGTGLGLYMSKMIIEDHLCGMIEVENKDNGACFKVSLLKEKGE
jgi:signal transduction histidine kinase